MTDAPSFGDAQGQPPSWFARVPTGAILDDQLTHAQVHILATICSYANNQGFAWPNLTTIQDKGHFAEATLLKGIKKLKERGYIVVVSKHRSHPKWRRVMGNVYRIMFDKELETDKLIDQMNNDDAKADAGLPQISESGVGDANVPEKKSAISGQRGALESLSEKGHTDIPDEGDSNHSEGLDVDQLVRATSLAQSFAAAAQQSHGQLRLVNPRAVMAAQRLVTEGWSDNEVRLEVMKELKRRRSAGLDAPHHLGDCLGVR